MAELKRLLVVVDMQHDFVDGALGAPEAVRILPVVRTLAEQWHGDVAYTQDTHGADYAATQEGKFLPVPHCIRGTRGWEIVPEVRTGKSARIFEKGTFGSVALAEYAKEYDEVALCGVCTDICVVSNALLIKAFSPEARVMVAGRACAGVTPAAHAAALRTMESCQVEIV